MNVKQQTVVKPLFSSSEHCQQEQLEGQGSRPRERGRVKGEEPQKDFSLSPNSPSSSLSQKTSSAGSDRILIRTGKTRDLTHLAQILADSFHSGGGIGAWFYPLLRLGIYEDLRTRLQSSSPRYVCLVAVISIATRPSECDYPVGTVEMALRSTHPWPLLGVPQYPYISNLAVRAEYRRQGSAEKMLLKCEQIALGWGFQDIYLHVMENNHQARQLYFKLGYRLHQIDFCWSSLLLRQPRRLLLHKHL